MSDEYDDPFMIHNAQLGNTPLGQLILPLNLIIISVYDKYFEKIEIKKNKKIKKQILILQNIER